MATNKFKITFEPVIILVLTLITLAVFILEAVFPGLSLDEIFVAPTSPKGLYPFSFTDPLSYVRIFTHIFGTKSVETWAFIFYYPRSRRKIRNVSAYSYDANFGYFFWSTVCMLLYRYQSNFRHSMHFLYGFIFTNY